MALPITAKDIKFLRLLPLLAKWINEDKRLEDKQIVAFANLFPEHYDPASDSFLDEMFEMTSQYVDHKTFGKWIHVIRSPEGKAWIETVFNRFRDLPLKAEKGNREEASPPDQGDDS
jgi:hypothetical protein